MRRQEGGITTGVALHNLESSPGLVRCDLMREGVLRDAASIPLAANGQSSWLIDQEFPAADTSDFAGSVRCDAVGEGRFSAVALENGPLPPAPSRHCRCFRFPRCRIGNRRPAGVFPKSAALQSAPGRIAGRLARDHQRTGGGQLGCRCPTSEQVRQLPD